MICPVPVKSNGPNKGVDPETSGTLPCEAPPVSFSDFETVTKRMRVQSLQPGMTFDLAQICTGFELLRPHGEIPVTPVPDPALLEILRTEVDPHGVFTNIPGL